MPTVYNGIGTWYWGKRNIRARRSPCEHCGRMADLKSYDTTRYFVFLMIPVIPLGGVHVVDSCPLCSQHRATSLKTWKKARDSVLPAVLREIAAKPRDRDLVQKAMGAAVYFQDEAALLAVSEHVSQHLADDAVTQAMLGSAFLYFDQDELGELALRTSLSLKSEPEVRRHLAWILLERGDVDEGWKIAAPLVDSAAPEALSLAFLATRAFQSLGRHREALAVLDLAGKRFPNITGDLEYRMSRSLSEKHLADGRKIPSAILRTRGAKQPNEHPLLARVPLLLSLLVLLAIPTTYFAASWWIGGHRTVWMVSGLDVPYTVSIAGQTVKLQPRAHVKVKLPEGTHQVTCTCPAGTIGPEPITISSSFWTRPFGSGVFVVNPDHQAVLMHEVITYALTQSAAPAPQMTFHAGSPVYRFSDVDYVFAPPPGQLTLPSNSGDVKRRRIDVVPFTDEMQEAGLVAGALDPKVSVERAVAGISFEPEEHIHYAVLAQLQTPAECAESMRPFLERRPVVVLAHCMYQSMVERSRPEQDLEAEYRALSSAAPEDAALQYLLARVMADRPASERLLEKAAKATPPSADAMLSLAYRHACGGKFDSSVTWLEKWAKTGDAHPAAEDLRRFLLVATKKADELLGLKDLNPPKTAAGYRPALERVTMLAKFKGKEAAEAYIKEFLAPQPGYSHGNQPSEDVPRSWEGEARALIEYVGGSPRALGELSSDTKVPSDAVDFQAAICAGRLDEAYGLAVQTKVTAAQSAIVVLLAARHATGTDAAVWKAKAIETLRTGDRDDRAIAGWLESEKAPKADEVLQLTLQPTELCTTCVLLGEVFPTIRGELFARARKLNVMPGFPRHLIDAGLKGGGE